MALNLCRGSLSTIIKCSTIINTPQIFRSQFAGPILNRLLVDTKPIRPAGFTSEENRPKLGLRKQNLPPYPHIECIRLLDVASFLPSHYKKVKYGEYEFLESADGYVQVYVQGFIHPRDLDARASYSVYFGDNHPLNSTGAVERRQSLNHAKIYGFLKALQQIPPNLIPKLCVCIDEIPFLTFIDRSLRTMSENSFRSTYTGKLNKDLETSMEINKVLRTRQDFILRLKYVPNDVGLDGIYHATKIAEKTAAQVTRHYLQDKRKNTNH